MPSATRTELACLKSASRSARSHAERMLAALPKEERDRLNRQAFDNRYVHVHDFTLRWKGK